MSEKVNKNKNTLSTMLTMLKLLSLLSSLTLLAQPALLTLLYKAVLGNTEL